MSKDGNRRGDNEGERGGIRNGIDRKGCCLLAVWVEGGMMGY